MGSTNFLQHNPTEANQEDDATYLADSLRADGIGTDATLPSPWLNKVWYQSSTFVAAFAQMLANKGYSVSDADLTTLSNILANVLTNADIKANLINVPFATTLVFDASQSNGFELDLSGNVTSSTLIGVSIGQVITFVIKQGSVAYSFVPPTNINGWIAIPATVNSCFVQQFIVTEDGSIKPFNSYSFGTLSGNNSSGYWVKHPSGLIEQWGSAVVFANGSSRNNVAISFPISFTAIPNILLTSDGDTDGTGQQPYTCYHTNKTINGCNVYLDCVVRIGGSGSSGFHNNVTVDWQAKGF